jgi:microcystin-dependent protein
MADDKAQRDIIAEVETTPGTVGDESLNPDAIPAGVFEMEDPNKNASPEINVRSPWKFGASAVTQELIDLIVPPGVVWEFGGTTAPTGFLMCDGAAVSRTTYAALFAVIGETFGVGDGSTTFNVPNREGVSATGVGAQDISGRTKTGPALGEVREDAMQGHRFFNGVARNTTDSIYVYGATTDECPGAATALAGTVSGACDRQGKTSLPKTDGTNGTPRTGAYTHGPEIGMNFIIKT